MTDSIGPYPLSSPSGWLSVATWSTALRGGVSSVDSNLLSNGEGPAASRAEGSGGWSQAALAGCGARYLRFFVPSAAVVTGAAVVSATGVACRMLFGFFPVLLSDI
jgi:hypothetical protein